MVTPAGALTPKAPTPLKQFSTEEISNEILLEKLNLRVEAVVIGCERGTLWWALGYPRHTVTLYNQSENQPNHSLDSGNKTPTHPQTHYLDLFITELERRVALETKVTLEAIVTLKRMVTTIDADGEDNKPPVDILAPVCQMKISYQCLQRLKDMALLLANAMTATQKQYKELKPFYNRTHTIIDKAVRMSITNRSSFGEYSRSYNGTSFNGSITCPANQAASNINRDSTSNREASDSTAVSPLTQKKRQKLIASIAETPMSAPAAADVEINFQRTGWFLKGEYVLVETKNDQVLKKNLNQTVANLIEDLKSITEDPQITDESICICVDRALLVLKAYDAYYEERHTGRFVGTAHTLGVALGTAPSLSDIIYPLALELDLLFKKLSVQAAANASNRQLITSFRPMRMIADTPPAPASETQPSDDL